MTATLSYTAGGSTREVSWPFTVATYGTLSKARTDLGTGGEAGFEWRVMQSVQGRGNDTPSAEQHLAGGHDGGLTMPTLWAVVKNPLTRIARVLSSTWME